MASNTLPGKNMRHDHSRAPGRLLFESLLLVLAVAGCSGSRPEEVSRATESPLPPLFMTGAMSVLLTNGSGFTAHVSAAGLTLPGDVAGRVSTGHLLCRGNHLLFLPDPKEASKRYARAGLSFVWDASDGRGFVLSEALQGYAPVSATIRPTNLVVRPDTGVTARLNGQECKSESATVEMTDGATMQFQVFRAASLNGLPCRIQTLTNSGFASIELSKVRLESPPENLFAIPEGFTKYGSAEAMMNELFMRQRYLKSGRSGPAGSELPITEPPKKYGPH